MLKKDHFIYLAPAVLFMAGAVLMFSNQDPASTAENYQQSPQPRVERSVASKKKEAAQSSSNVVKKKSVNQKKTSKVRLPVFDPNKNLSDQFSDLKKIEECYQNEGSCGFPMTDPKSEFFAIGQRLKTDLLKLQNEVMDQQRKDEQISEMARHFLKIADGHVKEAALHLMATQEPSEDNLESLLNDIIAYHDAKLIQQGMLELRRYLGNKQNESKIHQALANAMRTGSPFVAEQISKNLNAFINEDSLPLYMKTMSQLSKGSHTHKNLKNAINDYQRLLQSA